MKYRMTLVPCMVAEADTSVFYRTREEDFINFSKECFALNIQMEQTAANDACKILQQECACIPAKLNYWLIMLPVTVGDTGKPI